MSENHDHPHPQPHPKHAFFFGFITGFSVLSVISLAMLFIIWFTQSGFLGLVISGTKGETAVNSEPAPFEPVEMIERDSMRHISGTGSFYFIEYTDLECEFCKKFHNSTVNELQTEFDGRVGFVFKHFPLNVHPKAKREALAAECAGDQGKFFDYVNRIFEITPSNNNLEDEKLFDVAKKLDLDVDAFRECVDSERFLENVSADALEAQGTGATGAPHSLFIDQNGRILATFEGAVGADQIRETIEREMKENAY